MKTLSVVTSLGEILTDWMLTPQIQGVLKQSEGINEIKRREKVSP